MRTPTILADFRFYVSSFTCTDPACETCGNVQRSRIIREAIGFATRMLLKRIGKRLTDADRDALRFAGFFCVAAALLAATLLLQRYSNA